MWLARKKIEKWYLSVDASVSIFLRASDNAPDNNQDDGGSKFSSIILVVVLYCKTACTTFKSHNRRRRRCTSTIVGPAEDAARRLAPICEPTLKLRRRSATFGSLLSFFTFASNSKQDKNYSSHWWRNLSHIFHSAPPPFLFHIGSDY